MYTSETHNYPAKVLVETGFIGLLVLLGTWLAWVGNIYWLWRFKPGEECWALVWAGGMAAVTLEPLQIEVLLYLNTLKAKQGKVGEAQREIDRMAKSFPGLPAEFQKLLQVTP